MKIDNSKVRQEQIKRINSTKAERNAKEAESCLNKLTEAAKTGSGNLLELAVAASKARCTVGEISMALEVVYGRHVP